MKQPELYRRIETDDDSEYIIKGIIYLVAAVAIVGSFLTILCMINPAVK